MAKSRLVAVCIGWVLYVAALGPQPVFAQSTVLAPCPTIAWETDSTGFSCWAHQGAVFQYSCERGTFAVGKGSQHWISLTQWIPFAMMLVSPGQPIKRAESQKPIHLDLHGEHRFRLSFQRDNWDYELEHSPGANEKWKPVLQHISGPEISLAVSPDKKLLVIITRLPYGGGAGFLSGPSAPSARITLLRFDGTEVADFSIKNRWISTSPDWRFESLFPLVFRNAELGAGLTSKSPKHRLRALRGLVGGELAVENLDVALGLLVDEDCDVRREAVRLFSETPTNVAVDDRMVNYLASRANAIEKILRTSAPERLVEVLSLVERRAEPLAETWKAVDALCGSERFTTCPLFRRARAKAMISLRRYAREMRSQASRDELVSASIPRLVSLEAGHHVAADPEWKHLENTGKSVRSLQITPSGKHVIGLVSHGYHRVVRVWNAETGKVNREFVGGKRDHPRFTHWPVRAFWLTHDGKTLVYQSHNLRAVDFESGRTLWTTRDQNRLADVVFSKDSQLLIGRSDYMTRFGDPRSECIVLETRTGNTRRRNLRLSGRDQSFGFDSTGKTFVAGRGIYRLDKNEPVAELVDCPIGKLVSLDDRYVWSWNVGTKSLEGVEIESGARLFTFTLPIDSRCTSVEHLAKSKVRCKYADGAEAVWSLDLENVGN